MVVAVGEKASIQAGGKLLVMMTTMWMGLMTKVVVGDRDHGDDDDHHHHHHRDYNGGRHCEGQVVPKLSYHYYYYYYYSYYYKAYCLLHCCLMT